MPDTFPLADFNTVSAFQTAVAPAFTVDLPNAKTKAQNDFSAVFQPNGLQGVWATSHQQQVVHPINMMMQHFNDAAATLTQTLNEYYTKRAEIISPQNINTLAEWLWGELEVTIPLETTAVGALLGSVIPGLGTAIGAVAGLVVGSFADLVMDWLAWQGDFNVWVQQLLEGTAPFDLRYELITICQIWENETFDGYRQQLMTLEKNVMRDAGRLKSILDQQTAQWDQLAQTAQSSAAAPTFPVTTH